MAVFVFILWTFLGIGVTIAGGTKFNSIAYLAVILSPAGAVVAAIAALVTGLFPYGKRPWLRWLILPSAFVILGVTIFGLLGLLFTQSK